MKYIIIIILLSIFTGYKILAQEPITDANIHYTVLNAYEDHILNQMGGTITLHYEWLGNQSDHDYAGTTVMMKARVK